MIHILILISLPFTIDLDYKCLLVILGLHNSSNKVGYLTCNS